MTGDPKLTRVMMLMFTGKFPTFSCPVCGIVDTWLNQIGEDPAVRNNWLSIWSKFVTVMVSAVWPDVLLTVTQAGLVV